MNNTFPNILARFTMRGPYSTVVTCADVLLENTKWWYAPFTAHNVVTAIDHVITHIPTAEKESIEYAWLLFYRKWLHQACVNMHTGNIIWVSPNDISVIPIPNAHSLIDTSVYMWRSYQKEPQGIWYAVGFSICAMLLAETYNEWQLAYDLTHEYMNTLRQMNKFYIDEFILSVPDNYGYYAEKS